MQRQSFVKRIGTIENELVQWVVMSVKQKDNY